MNPAAETNKNTQLQTACKLCAILAALCAAAFVLALAYRPLSSVDLGYHLAYGEVFWREGRIVNDSSFIASPSTADTGQAGDLPPGAYYDAAGHFRFPNANWLTQVIMAALHRFGGWNALITLQMALVAVILAAQAGILRRFKVSLAWLAPIWLATGLTAYERFVLRPELLGYACLLVQLWLLAGHVTWRRIILAALVQLLAVNVHSYWLLGVALAVAFAADASARAAWQKWIVQVPRLPEELRREWGKRVATVAIFLPLAFVNPFTWRGAILPVQTLHFLRQNHIASATMDQVTSGWLDRTLHPWAYIGEFYTPFTPGLMGTWVTGAFIALLAAMGIAALVLAWRRKWALLGVLAITVAIGLTMRRNIAPAAMLAWPLVGVAASMVIASLRGRGRNKPAPAAKAAEVRWLMGLSAGLSGLVLLVGAWLLYNVATNRFYLDERREWRFGSGISRQSLPLGPCAWLDAHLPKPEPIFTDSNVSSSVAYFCKNVTAVPVLTNTWAYTPGRLKELYDIIAGLEPLEPRTTQWGMDFAMFQVWPMQGPMVRKMLDSGQWALVYTESWFVVLARRTPDNAYLIARNEIHLDTCDTGQLVALAWQDDPAPAFALKATAGMLQSLRWFAQADRVWRACLAEQGQWHEAWLNLGVCLIEEGRANRRGRISSGMEQYREAEKCFAKAAEIRPDYKPAGVNLENVRKDIAAMEQADAALPAAMR